MKSYPIEQVFITKKVVYDSSTKSIVDLPRYLFLYSIVIEQKDGYLNSFDGPVSLKYYKNIKSFHELEIGIFWGELNLIWPYLNREEIESKKVSYKRLKEIFLEVNSKQKIEKNSNIIKLRPKLK